MAKIRQRHILAKWIQQITGKTPKSSVQKDNQDAAQHPQSPRPDAGIDAQGYLKKIKYSKLSMKAKTAFDKNCSFWHSRLAPEVTICPQHLAFSSTGCPYERMQQAAATQFANHPSLQHSHLPKQQHGVKNTGKAQTRKENVPKL